MMIPENRLASRLLSLPPDLRISIARSLGLIDPGDSDTARTDGERYALWLARARERGLLGLLWAAIDLVGPDGPGVDPNPFQAPSGDSADS